MKNVFTAIMIIILSLIATNLKAQVLVQNGSAEYYDTANFVPSEWTVVSGNWTSQDHSIYTSSAHDGVRIFFEGGDASGELQQDVNVSGYVGAIDSSIQYFSFSGWVQSKYEVAPADQTTITIQCLDANKVQVLYVWHSDTTASTNAWTQKTNHFKAPPGTRFVRISLIAIRNQGSTNDGYFDDIVLNSDTATGVQNVTQNNMLSFTPNPVTDHIHISFNTPGSYSVNITSSLGITVMSRIINTPGDIDVSSLPAGVYYLRAFSRNKTGVQITKFIKE